MKPQEPHPHSDPDALHSFEQIFEAEILEIMRRRAYYRDEDRNIDPRRQLAGLALSGGGIRSATFALGTLQSLARNGLLTAFDYLSTVSGGGYLGGWWSAWLSRQGDGRADRTSREGLDKREIIDPALVVQRLLAPGDPASCLLPALSEQLRLDLAAAVRTPGWPQTLSDALVDHMARDLHALVQGEVVLWERPEVKGRLAATGAGPIVARLDALAQQTGRPAGDTTNDRERSPAWNRRLNRVFINALFRGAIVGGIFPQAERSELDRAADYMVGAGPLGARGRVTDGALNAGRDPIHHLRLFANYLTPRRGMLSADTWRAIAVLRRNLTLTWLAIVPILVAVMLLAQLFFVLHPLSSESFPHRHPGRAEIAASRAVTGTAASLTQVRAQGIRARLPAGRRPERSGGLALAVLATSAEVGYERLARTRSRAAIYSEQGGIMIAASRAAGVALSRPQDVRIPEPAPRDTVQSGRLALGQSPIPEVAADSVLVDFKMFQHGASDLDTGLNRFGALLWFVTPFWGWIVLVSVAWMLAGQGGTELREKFTPVLALVAVVLVAALVALVLAGTRELPDFIVEGAGWWWDVEEHGIRGPLLWSIVALLLLWRGCRTTTPGAVRHRSSPMQRLLSPFKRLARAFRRDDPMAGHNVAREAQLQWRKEMRRNQFTRIHAALLGIVVVGGLVLALAGFGHELVDYIFINHDGSPIKQVGGWGAIATTIAGAIFAALKSAPSSDDDRKKADNPSLVRRLLFALMPPALVVLLALGAAWTAHEVLELVAYAAVNSGLEQRHDLGVVLGLNWFAFISAILCFIFAWYEMRTSSHWASKALLLVSVAVIGASAGSFFLDWGPLLHPERPIWTLLITVITGGMILVRMVIGNSEELGADGRWRAVRWKSEPLRDRLRRLVGERRGYSWEIVIAGALASLLLCGLVVFGFWLNDSWADLLGLADPIDRAFSGNERLMGYVLTGILLSLSAVLVKIFWGLGYSRRSVYLAATAYMILVALMAISYQLKPVGFSTELSAHIAIGMIAGVVAWSVALGWVVDPNPLSMHEFYKARLTRAYLGASNPKRRVASKEITEAVEGDDVLVQDLANCQRGAPYHLINTTLNLAGGRDLAIAQRSAASFLISRLFCGSMRTGFRSTANYMGGRISLGTAMAISGAAASPNMGSKTPSAALAMLMTFFNVRLGYWAPTPDREDWRRRQARMWPFYVLREFMSQTTDLANYCYLTDGGHFENTGLYSLVQRGCRSILLVDCGADRDGTFIDLGDAIRRCRIDFGAEIDLPGAVVDGRAAGGDSRNRHFMVGTVRYSRAHLESLGWHHTPGLDEEGLGCIVVIKPNVTSTETLDVRQHGAAHAAFPQESTGDQFFDEAQFESYRQLGQLSADDLFAALKGLQDVHPPAYGAMFDAVTAFRRLYEAETKPETASAAPPSSDAGSVTS